MEELYLQCPAACEIILQYLDHESLSNFLKVNEKWILFKYDGTMIWTRIIRYYMENHRMFMNGKTVFQTVHNGLEIWNREEKCSWEFDIIQLTYSEVISTL